MTLYDCGCSSCSARKTKKFTPTRFKVSYDVRSEFKMMEMRMPPSWLLWHHRYKRHREI